MIILKDPALLQQKVLSKHFDNTKYASFLRQVYTLLAALNDSKTISN